MVYRASGIGAGGKVPYLYGSDDLREAEKKKLFS